MLYNVLEELREAGVGFEYTGNEEWVNICCPFHKDKNPSCGIHVQEGRFLCHSCGKSGDFVKFMAGITKSTLDQAKLKLADKYQETIADKPVENSVYEKWHKAIDAAGPLKAELYKRGLTDEQIRKHRIGVERGRITIPIFNALGVCVNVIKYAPGATTKKFTNMTGRGKPLRLYPIDQLEYRRILLCGGMIKAIPAAAELNKHGIGAISCTGGEQSKNWSSKTLKSITKDTDWIGICMDIDATGVAASKELALRLVHLVPEVSIVTLPLDPEKYPKGDLSDWIGAEKQEIKPLLDESTPFEVQLIPVPSAEPPEDASIEAMQASENVGKRLKFRAMVSANGQDAFFLPKEVTVRCSREADFCFVCPIMRHPIEDTDNSCTITIDPEEVQLLGMMDMNEKQVAEKLKTAIRIPPCKNVRFERKTAYTANNVLLTQDVDDNAIEDVITISAVTVGCSVQAKEVYDFVGRVVSHPETQRSTSVLSELTPVADTLSQYVPQPKLMERFQPIEWTIKGIANKLKDIYNEYENHVTRIYKRQDLHLLFDLAWHSVLFFEVDHRVNKGWVEVLAVGDSSQGKTETTLNMMRHYGLGQRVDCKGASAAGLLGGLQQVNKQWFASWGIIPSNDRKLVILEELKGLDPESLSRLTDMRSSGIAEIPKIEKAKTSARTRLVAVSNSRKGNDVSSYAFGVTMIKELIPNLEDIRRFDAFMILSKDDISIDLMRKLSGQIMNGDHKQTYTKEASRNLVLWGWTRKQDEIKFEDWRHLIDVTHDLCNKFTDAIPIVDRGSMRFKLARLAIALAVRTYSHEGTNVLVRRAHVDYIARFLVGIYTAEAFGYDRYTAMIKERDSMGDENAVRNSVRKLPNPGGFIRCMQYKDEFDGVDIRDASTLVDSQELGSFISMLTMNRAIVRGEKGKYRKSTKFTAMLIAMLKDESLPMENKPDYITNNSM